MKHFYFRQWLSFVIILFCFNTLHAEEASKALTLEAALATVDTHPDFQVALAERNAAIADRDIASSRTDTSLNLEGILRSGQQNNANTGFLPDNSVRLTAR